MWIDDAFRDFLRSVPGNPDHARHLAGLLTSNRLPERWYAYKHGLMKDHVDERALFGFLDMWTKGGFADRLGATNVPGVAIVGEHDSEMYSDSNMRSTFGRHFENFDVITIAGASHYPMCETPLVFAKALEDHLRRIEAQAC